LIINWKPLTATYLYHAKIKPRKLIKALLSINLVALDEIVGTSAKLSAAYTPELKNIHITHNLQSYLGCEQFQHIKALL
jgi:hypothetical protein